MKKVTQKGFRTWKSGKQWLFVGATFAAFLVGGSMTTDSIVYAESNHDNVLQRRKDDALNGN
ncbi:KxYKxGKxW signal peptide domain-containing protein, partial [Streptococcus castoreus]|uniref:KxYKxGKxW signal peptide domain-containing protein n=1 Tax=Streptococcus castoreus TaxID=254786 RepID=UPI000480FF02